MIKLKRLTIALAALLIASATAWAQTPGVAQLTVPDSWSNDYATLISENLPDDFVMTTADVAKAMDSPDATAQTVILIYSLDGYITFTNSGKEVSSLPATRGFLYNQQSQGTRIYYTTASNEVELTEVTAGKQWKIETMPAANVTLNVEYEPELTATFKAGNANTIQAGKATVTVTEKDGTTAYTGATLDADGNYKPLYEDQTITLTAATGYKFRSVTAKKGGGLLSLQIGGVFTATIYYVEGETWKQAITNHPTENAGWAIDNEGDVYYNNGYYMFTNGSWTSGDTLIDPNASYAFEEL